MSDRDVLLINVLLYFAAICRLPASTGKVPETVRQSTPPKLVVVESHLAPQPRLKIPLIIEVHLLDTADITAPVFMGAMVPLLLHACSKQAVDALLCTDT